MTFSPDPIGTKTLKRHKGGEGVSSTTKRTACTAVEEMRVEVRRCSAAAGETRAAAFRPTRGVQRGEMWRCTFASITTLM